MAGRPTRSSKVRLVDSLCTSVVQSTASTACVEAAPWEAIEAVEAVEPQQVPAVPGSQVPDNHFDHFAHCATPTFPGRLLHLCPEGEQEIIYSRIKIQYYRIALPCKRVRRRQGK